MKECIFCWGDKRLTREHIIPKSIFTWWKFKERLIVLPSCHKCNWEYAKIEQTFVHQLQMVRAIDKEKIKNKLIRLFRNPKLQKISTQIKKSFGYKKLNGEQRLSTKLDKQNFDKVLLKIAQWLHYLHDSSKLIYSDYEIVIHRKEASDLSELQNIQKKIFIDEIDWSTLEKWKDFPWYFSYEFKKIEGGMNIFKLIFYEDIEFYIITF